MHPAVEKLVFKISPGGKESADRHQAEGPFCRAGPFQGRKLREMAEGREAFRAG